MPVVIDDLDVEVAATPVAPGAPASADAGEPTAERLEALASHLAARNDRVRAD